MPPGAFGPRLRANLGVLAGGYRLGKRPVRQMASDMLGLSLSTGMTCRLGRQGAAELRAPVEELREHVRGADSGHIDEAVREQGQADVWPWAAVTKMAAVFTIAPGRGADVARAMLGTAARKVVISDRLESYNRIKRWQSCWARPRRDSQAMIDRGGEAGEVGRRLMEHSDARFGWWYRVRDGTLSRSSFRLSVSWPRARPVDDLGWGAACSCPRTAGTCRELLPGETHLWTFARVEGIEPTGNDAERELRHAVICRKASGGTDSESGSRFVERMLSAVATCRQQGLGVLDYLTHCYQAHLDGHPAPSLLPATSDAQAA
ncbi:Transposase IS66 family protein [Tautonia plasticadhaerens]|uniref:Transposase IS66 family protein n=1 Tax=Tautonia plasticadhaerens TaxID=2527974 RepID=A0A518H9U7_9BACT|nr:Transposase IS66 family protein [Tautonia plasticadhaerens]